MQAFHVDSDKAAKVLIQEAANTIYGKSEFGSRPISKDELDGLWALMKGINPRDGLDGGLDSGLKFFSASSHFAV